MRFTRLVNRPWTGEPPEFPLPRPVVMSLEFDPEIKKRVAVPSEFLSEQREAREAELWQWVWEQPQAAVWAHETWRWYLVAMWVRTAARCEAPDATATDRTSLHRFADQIGLTPAGLRENGWEIVEEAVSRSAEDETPPTSSRDRVKRARSGDGG